MSKPQWKDCPFCGSKDVTTSILWDQDDGSFARYLGCTDCGATGPVCQTKQDAVDAWNKRSK